MGLRHCFQHHVGNGEIVACDAAGNNGSAADDAAVVGAAEDAMASGHGHVLDGDWVVADESVILLEDAVDAVGLLKMVFAAVPVPLIVRL